VKFPDLDSGTSGKDRREIHSDPFSWPARVYWEDTDAGGVVYHARYLAFMERARSEWMRALGWGQEHLRTVDDVAFAVRAMELDFRAPARLDDQLQVSVRLLECRGASFSVGQRIERAGALLVEGTVRIAALRASDFKPRPIPDALLAELKPLLETA
jgi:acyl-CoA thioester hydrolase